MANLSRLGKALDRQPRRWFPRLLKSLRSKLTWRDVIVGFCVTAAISAIMVGFRYQNIPEFKEGQTANQDIRASKDAQYIDSGATAQKRAEAENSVPFVYQLNQDRVTEIESAVSRVFNDARRLLEEKGVSQRQRLSLQETRELLDELKVHVGDFLPTNLLTILLRERFAPAIEKRIIEILDVVLKEGIVGDRKELEDRLKTGVVIRD
jgi:membrane-associated HD superfamily phosphohydrolase